MGLVALSPVPAARDRLVQVLTNLLSNASKAAVPGRIARLAWPAAALLLCVEDNGRGIAPAEQHQLFDKLYQARHQSLRKPGGPGLGRAGSRKIVALHQGRIGVESVPGQGARFFVELPLAAPVRAQPAGLTPSHPR